MNLTPASLKTPRRKDSKHSTRAPHPNLFPLHALIVAECQFLEALNTHKRGLMQQLLPCPEEVEA